LEGALGLIEVKGFAAATAACDAALKAAGVRVLGYEETKGGGLVVVKWSGDVASVQAAVEAAVDAASAVTHVFAARVIARPAIGSDANEPALMNAQVV